MKLFPIIYVNIVIFISYKLKCFSSLLLKQKKVNEKWCEEASGVLNSYCIVFYYYLRYSNYLCDETFSFLNVSMRKKRNPLSSLWTCSRQKKKISLKLFLDNKWNASQTRINNHGIRRDKGTQNTILIQEFIIIYFLQFSLFHHISKKQLLDDLLSLKSANNALLVNFFYINFSIEMTYK